jgi:hypothetical protein
MSALAPVAKENVIEQVLIGGDLAKLSPQERLMYYKNVCQSLGLNPLTRPFDYITLNGKLTLYARKDAAEQLRQLHGISIEKPEIRFEDDWIIVTVAASNIQGRTDADVGVVSKKDMRGDFGNALMKAVTKAKRRVTLSICGLGMLDETEIETIPQEAPVPQIVEQGGDLVEVEAAHPYYQAWVDNGVVQHVKHGVQLNEKYLHLSLEKMPLDDFIRAGVVYRSWRDTGLSTADAATKTLAGEVAA